MKFNVLILIYILLFSASRINANYEDLEKVMNGDLIGNPDLAFENLDRMVQECNIKKLFLISLGSPETLNKNTGVIRWAPYIYIVQV